MTAKATCNGTITATGGENCTSRGFEWGLVLGGPYPNSWTEAGSFDTGAFSHQFTGLDENTIIYYRAKAYNSAGWGYGGEQSFTTWKTVSAVETGVCSENIIAIIGQYLALYDDGHSSDSTSVGYSELAISESGVSTEALGIGFTLLDSGVGTEEFTRTYELLLLDSVVSFELAEAAPVSGHIVVYDVSLAADFAFRLQGYLRLDDFDLPHVQTLHISEDPQIRDVKIQGGSLPKRSILSKMGRVVEIEGWTDSQSDVDDLEAMKDGTVRVFLHPSGDSFAVLVSDVQVDNRVDDYGRRNYMVTLKETREW